jgi:hypothetical protein
MLNVEVGAEQSVVQDGFSFPEGLRWRDGAMWFSDMHTGDVYTLDPDSGALDKCLVVDDQPSGMGWLPDGSMLLSLMLRRHVLRVFPDGSTAVHADLSDLTDHPINELVVDAAGHGYLGTFGYNIYAGDPLVQASVYLVDADGTVSVAADAFDFPNGSVILPGTNTLVIAHSFRPELTGFEIEPDGTLINRRVWSVLPEGTTADGLAVDSIGRVWVSSILTNEFLRVSEGGEVTARVHTPGRLAVDCVVDGRDDNVLYISTSNSIQPAETKVRLGSIQRVTL